MQKEKAELEFLTESVDRIDNAVWEAVKEMALNSDEMEWDMSIIGEVADYIEETLKQHNIPTCYPYRLDDEVICYTSLDRCAYCPREQIGGVLDA